jgi:hypothetical protein
MPDELETVLRLVSEGRLTPEEAEPILAAISTARRVADPASDPQGERPGPPAGRRSGERHVLIRVTEGEKTVVNLRVPLGFAGLAAGLLPGISDSTLQRIRDAVDRGESGPLIDVQSEDGTRVVIATE